jgi:hypothetical protein
LRLALGRRVRHVGHKNCNGSINEYDPPDRKVTPNNHEALRVQEKQERGQACQDLGDGVGDVVNVDVVCRISQLPQDPTSEIVATVWQSLGARDLAIEIQYLDVGCRPSVKGEVMDGEREREEGSEG